MSKSILTLPSVSSVARWISGNFYGEFIASNQATVLSLDFPVPGSCKEECEYCFGARGHQGTWQAVKLQWERFEEFLRNPEGFAVKTRFILDHFAQTFDFRIGSKRFPFRLLGCGDLGDVDIFKRFYEALTQQRIHVYGYTRHLGVPGNLWFSADYRTPSRVIVAAKQEGRRVAYVRRPGDGVPSGVDLVFPEHREAHLVPRHRLDCFKIRNDHEDGACYRCRRCFKARVDTVRVAA